MSFILNNIVYEQSTFYVKNKFFLHFRTKFPNERIPSLDEAVAVCCNLGLKMYIEIKSGSQVDKVRKCLDSCGQNI